MIQSHHENHVQTRPYSSFARSQSQLVKRLLTEQWVRREGDASVPPPPPPLTPSSVYGGIDRDHPTLGSNTSRGDSAGVGSLMGDGGSRFMESFNHFGGGSLGRNWNDVESGEDIVLAGNVDREGESADIGNESVTEVATDGGALCQSELLLRREVGAFATKRDSADGAEFAQNFDFQDLT